MITSNSNKKFLFITILVFCFFILGSILEYKLGVIKEIQYNRNAKIWYKPLPEFPSKFNNKSGLNTQILEDLPLNDNDKSVWRESVRKRIYKDIKGELFPTQPVHYEVLSSKDKSELKEQEILITSFDGQLIPARVFLPLPSKKLLPAILLVPGHAGSQSGMLQLADETNSYQHAAARKLAASGFITIAFELRGFGYLGLPNYPEHNIWAYNALKNGESYKGLILKDTAHAVSLLRNHPLVDPNRIGISGMSYGGEVAVQYASLDLNIKAVSFHSYAGSAGVPSNLESSSELPHLCHILPGIDSWMSQEGWMWLLAPRNAHGVRGENDQKDFLKNQKLYSKGWGDKSKIKIEIIEGGHEYFIDSSISFFTTVL